MLSVIGGAYKERWPNEESRIIFLSPVFTYTQRIKALTFLYGNLRDVDLVYAAVLPQFGVDPRDLDHARRLLADLASGRYDRRYYYFDVLATDWLFLNGTVNTRHAPPTPFRLCTSRACLGARMHAHASRADRISPSSMRILQAMILGYLILGYWIHDLGVLDPVLSVKVCYSSGITFSILPDRVSLRRSSRHTRRLSRVTTVGIYHGRNVK